MITGISGLAGSGKDTVAKYLIEEGFVSIAMADGMKRICKEVFGFTDEQLWGPSQFRNAPDERYPRPHSALAVETGCQCACCGYMERGKVYSENPPQCCYLTPRYALQQLGSEWGRGCYPDIWCEYTMRTAQQLLDHIGTTKYTPQEGLTVLTMGDILESSLLQDPPPKEVIGVVIPDVRFKNEMNAIRRCGGQVWRVKRPGAGLSGSSGRHDSELQQLEVPDDWFDAVIENDGTLEDLREKVMSLIR